MNSNPLAGLQSEPASLEAKDWRTHFAEYNQQRKASGMEMRARIAAIVAKCAPRIPTAREISRRLITDIRETPPLTLRAIHWHMSKLPSIQAARALQNNHCALHENAVNNQSALRSDGSMEPLLTELDVANRLALDIEAVKRMRRDMRGPPYIEITPRVYRYRAADLARWIDEKSFPAPALVPVRLESSASISVHNLPDGAQVIAPVGAPD